ncbi:hypothetical protein Hanom_Chr08g00682261 [Helianthus anomalus]
MKRTSSAKQKCDMSGPPFGIFTPRNKPVSTAFFMSMLSTSIARMKRKGDIGSPCLNPLLYRNSVVGDPLIRTEPFPDNKHPLIQEIHFSGKAMNSKVLNKNFQLRES